MLAYRAARHPLSRTTTGTLMILRSAPASPFGRKVRIAAALLGLSDRITVVDADTTNPTDSLRRENPLGKIPTLILDNAETLFDSRVIVAYLDHLAGGGIVIPSDPDLRFPALKLEALADGLCDAALLQVYEGRFRDSSKHDPTWLEHQAGKVGRTLTVLEDGPPAGPITIGHVALACALGYLDLRFSAQWRDTCPNLAGWLTTFAETVPAFDATRVKV